MVRFQRAHGCHRALWARARAQRELWAEEQCGTVATAPPEQPLPHSSPLTLALPAPGPMGFMMVYMFSLELVESGEDMHEGLDVGASPKHTPSLTTQALVPPGLGMIGVPGGPPPPGGPCTQINKT